MIFQQVTSMLWIFVKFFLTQKKVGAWCCDCFLTNALIAYFDETFRQRLYTITPWLILQVYFPPSWTDKQQRKLLEKPKRDAKAQNWRKVPGHGTEVTKFCVFVTESCVRCAEKPLQKGSIQKIWRLRSICSWIFRKIARRCAEKSFSKCKTMQSWFSQKICEIQLLQNCQLARGQKCTPLWQAAPVKWRWKLWEK